MPRGGCARDRPDHNTAVMSVGSRTLVAVAEDDLAVPMPASADQEADVDSGSTDVPDLAAMIGGHELVDVRMALIRLVDGWQIRHGEVTMDTVASTRDRTWQYPEDVFLERRVPGSVVAALMREEPQEVDGFKMITPRPVANGTFRRLAGQVKWSGTSMVWPRTQWDVYPSESRLESMSTRPDGLLIGDGPSFLHFEAAFSSFFYGALPSNRASWQWLWRIIQVDRRAWLHRVTIAPDVLTIAVKGTELDGVRVELTTPTTRVDRPIGRTRKVRLRLPSGLANDSLLMLRNEDDWLDYRYFQSPVPGRERDASVIWDLPGTELSILLAGGEGPYVEFKQEVSPTAESRKKILKTVAAFASGEGGTVLFGVTDDARVMGIDPAAQDRLMVAVGNMIRDSIEPEPSYDLRIAELNGKTVLLVEVTAGGRWYAVNPAKPEFYVRRGASTVPARMDEIASGFSQQPGRLSHRTL